MENLLGRALPIIRHIRTPLISGYVWLLAIWVCARPFRDRFDTEEGFVAVIDEALSTLGSVGQGVALSFAAYLIGSAVSDAIDRRLLPPPPALDLDGRPIKVDDKPVIRELSVEDNRTLGESRLRAGVALPAFVAVAGAAVQFGWRWWALIAVPFVVAGHGLILYRRAQRADAVEFQPDRSQFSTRYATASQQLASEERIVRMAGLFELGKLADHSLDYRETIFDVLAASIRHRSPLGTPDKAAFTAEELAAAAREGPDDEVQTALTALGGVTHGPREGGQRVDLARCYLPGAVLEAGDYQHVNLDGSVLYGANLRKANLTGANLREADLRGADLGGADLRRADLRGADLRRADLRGADLRGADLGGADLRGADLRGADLREANLRGANLGGADLGGANLHRANLRGANLHRANLREANLGGANLHRANLREANLGGANLREANLSGANLIEAYLGGAKLIEAYLSEADLFGANLSEAELREADLSEADLSEADLSEADLSEADLSGANLREADLREADLSEADLSEADLSEADLSEADLSGAKLSGADLTGAHLGGAKLSRADLRGANLTGANLNGANLNGANLIGANLIGANLEGAKLEAVSGFPGLDGLGSEPTPIDITRIGENDSVSAETTVGLEGGPSD